MSRIKEKKRLREIIKVFVKYGVKKGKISPNNLRLAFEELGPTYVKLGQILSTRPDMLPQSYIEEFEKLQDNVKQLPYSVINEILEKKYNGKIDSVFNEINEEPLASASMSQVHKAVLKNGDDVVIKILRPKIKETMLSDMAILRKLAVFAKVTPQGQVLDVKEAIDFFTLSIEKESDLKQEALNIVRFRKDNSKEEAISCPKVYLEYSGENVLVMEYVKGVKITNIKELDKRGYDLSEIAEKLAHNYIKQVLEDGFFHADPHPGNIVIKDKKIMFLDFGMMAEIDENMQKIFNTMLMAVGERDIQSMTSAIIKIGVKKGKINRRLLYSDIEGIYNQYIDQSLHNINIVQIINDITKVAKKNNINMPASIMMFVKGMMTLEGVIETIYPQLSIMDIAMPYIQARLLFKKDIKKETYKHIMAMYLAYKKFIMIPPKTLEVLNALNAGKLKLKLEHIGLVESMHYISKMVNRIVVGLIVSALIIGSSLVINSNAGSKIYGISFLGILGYISAAIVGIWLVASIIKSGKM